jgi:hypothetical protein
MEKFDPARSTIDFVRREMVRRRVDNHQAITRIL